MNIYTTYKAMLQGETEDALTEEEFVAIQGGLEALVLELDVIGKEIEEECELPTPASDWTVRDTILFLEASEGMWYEQIFLKSLRGQQNLIEMLTVLESRA